MTTEAFQERVTNFCKTAAIGWSDPFLWSDILSKGLFSTYMPAEYVWQNRTRPWDWPAIEKMYAVGPFMAKYRVENWSYRYMLDQWHSRRYCVCATWLH